MHAHTVALAANHAAALTPPHAHGSVIVLAVLAGAAGLTLWAFRYTRRLVCWLIAFAAGICAIGVGVWSDALVALVTSGPGQIALIVIVFASGITFYLVAVHDAQGRKIRQAKRKRRKDKKDRGRDDYDDDVSAELALTGGKEIVIPRRSNTLDRRSHHHHIGSPAVAAIFGTSFSLLVITFGLIMTDLWESFTSLGSTVATQSGRASSGKAAAAAVAGHGQSPGHIVLIGAAILIAVLYGGHRVSRRIHGDKNKNNDGGNGGGGGRGGRKKRGRNRGGGQVQNNRPTQELGWH